MKSSKYRILLLLASVAAMGAATGSAAAAGATMASPVQSSFGVVDFANAKPMPLPRPAAAPSLAELGNAPAVAFGAAGVSAGGLGNGIRNPVKLGEPEIAKAATPQAVIPEESGTSGIPFTTSRVNAYNDNTQIFYPFVAAGRLFFNIPGDSGSHWCTAGLIKPGVIVTAAHCVANFGKQQFYSGWTFVPAYENGVAPYGAVYTAAVARVVTSYYNGTDPCAQSGVTCQDDVAVILLNKVKNLYPGPQVGWFAYGWNGYGFNSNSQALITQLGYTENFVGGEEFALDGGQLQERTDSQGQTISSLSNNTVIGSLQSNGSSGGPWVVNLGIPPVLTNINFGTAAAPNTIVGVTSWGYTDPNIKEQGASPFTTGNIVALVNAICTGAPAGAC